MGGSVIGSMSSDVASAIDAANAAAQGSGTAGGATPPPTDAGASPAVGTGSGFSGSRSLAGDSGSPLSGGLTSAIVGGGSAGAVGGGTSGGVSPAATAAPAGVGAAPPGITDTDPNAQGSGTAVEVAGLAANGVPAATQIVRQPPATGPGESWYRFGGERELIGPPESGAKAFPDQLEDRNAPASDPNNADRFLGPLAGSSGSDILQGGIRPAPLGLSTNSPALDLNSPVWTGAGGTPPVETSPGTVGYVDPAYGSIVPPVDHVPPAFSEASDAAPQVSQLGRGGILNPGIGSSDLPLLAGGLASEPAGDLVARDETLPQPANVADAFNAPGKTVLPAGQSDASLGREALFGGLAPAATLPSDLLVPDLARNGADMGTLTAAPGSDVMFAQADPYTVAQADYGASPVTEVAAAPASEPAFDAGLSGGGFQNAGPGYGSDQLQFTQTGGAAPVAAVPADPAQLTPDIIVQALQAIGGAGSTLGAVPGSVTGDTTVAPVVDTAVAPAVAPAAPSATLGAAPPSPLAPAVSPLSYYDTGVPLIAAAVDDAPLAAPLPVDTATPGEGSGTDRQPAKRKKRRVKEDA